MFLNALPLDFQFLLVTLLQIMLTGGVGGVFIVGYATKDIFTREENLQPTEPQFATEYDELMWLAERQKHHLSHEETRRFYQLRQEWTKMHALPRIGNSLY